MKILFIFGTRPEAIKMAPIIIKMKDKVDSFEVSICVTGQHREMLAQVLNFFSLVPDYNLDIMKKNQSLFDITANSLSLLEGVIDDSKPDLIMVQGDTTSALVGGLAGYYKKIRVAHIEAGLRSGDKFTPFPEEMNRILVARLADYHFAPTDRAKNALIYEGVSSDNIFVVGNSVIDALLLSAQLINKDNKKYIKEFSGIDFTKKIILVTGHRRENFGKGFEDICIALEEISSTHDKSVEIVYPVHLNPNVRDVVFERLNGRSNIHLIEPLSYPSLIWLMNKSYLVLTDSGEYKKRHHR